MVGNGDRLLIRGDGDLSRPARKSSYPTCPLCINLEPDAIAPRSMQGSRIGLTRRCNTPLASEICCTKRAVSPHFSVSNKEERCVAPWLQSKCVYFYVNVMLVDILALLWYTRSGLEHRNARFNVASSKIAAPINRAGPLQPRRYRLRRQSWCKP